MEDIDEISFKPIRTLSARRKDNGQVMNRLQHLSPFTGLMEYELEYENNEWRYYHVLFSLLEPDG